MDTTTDEAPAVVDAQIVPETNATQVLLDLEQLIKTNVANIDKGKSELKKQREMLASALENDETYRLHNEEAKKAAKTKMQTKYQIMQLPQNKQLAEKVKSVAADIKEADGALSDYLREYQRMSGATEIETDDGQIREIVYTAKLVKKSPKFNK
jgi:Skp family chaperone for outer membrane proteins